MRDPERIGPIMRELEALWRAAPDLRLGQLLENVHSQAVNDGLTRADLFDVEDNVIQRGIWAFGARLTRNVERR